MKNRHSKTDPEQNRKSDASRRSLSHYSTIRFQAMKKPLPS